MPFYFYNPKRLMDPSLLLLGSFLYLNLKLENKPLKSWRSKIINS